MFEDYLLIQKMKKGDSEAWEQLVDKYYDQIYFYCVRRCYGQSDLAADLTQDIFLKIVENIQSYRYTGKFFNYLYTAAVNHCNNYYKKKKLEELEFKETYLVHLDGGEADEWMSRTESELLQAALNELPAIQREALILKYYHGLKVKDIAKITGTKSSTVQSRIHQGLSKLTKILDREEWLHD